MGFRLSKIYTRTGDDGSTAIAGGQRLAKNHIRIEAIGCIDEINSSLGVLLIDLSDTRVRQLVLMIQNQLFELGAELAAPDYQTIGQQQVDFLESQLDDLNSQLPPLEEFILPGGCPSAARAHMTRTLCRRAERSLVELNETEGLRQAVLSYINRLSDLFFVVARYCNRLEQVEDILWKREP